MSLQDEDAAVAAISTAPRVTLEDLERKIVGEHYFNMGQAAAELGQPYLPGTSLDLLTICVLVLSNGFTITGESACASPENFNEEMGRKIARDMAIRKLWGFEGYLLRERLGA